MMPDVESGADRVTPLLGSKQAARPTHQKMWRIVMVLVALNAAVLTALLIVSRTYPPLFSAGLLALSFGLRHAVDADHIAAIDNVTRRLIADGRQPLLVGLWFSLGHSGVVCLICVATACGAEYMQHSGLFEGVCAVISTAVSSSILLLIGSANLFTLLVARGDRHGGSHGEDARGGHTHSIGLVARCCPSVMRLIDAEWKMFGLGFFFGLGFETSSEVALLALAAMSPSQGIPPIATLLLPLLFAGGMSLIDTLDGLLMSWTYSYASSNEGRAEYNVYLTIASSVIAIGVGLIELLGCFQVQFDLHGPLWSVVAFVNDNFEYVGYAIIAFFVVSAAAVVALITCPASGGCSSSCVKRPATMAAG